MFQTGNLGSTPELCRAPFLDGISSRRVRRALKRDDLDNDGVAAVINYELTKTARRRSMKLRRVSSSR